MRPIYYVLFLLLFGDGSNAELISSGYESCFRALEKRIQTYCNCRVYKNKYLVLTSKSGFKARVEIDTTANGLPDVAWVLNQVNKSGHPGKLKSFVENQGNDKNLWIIEESIRKWDLENTKEGLSMGTPQKINRRYKFDVASGDCHFDSLDVSIEVRSEKTKETLNLTRCQNLENEQTRDVASVGQMRDFKFNSECEAIISLGEL